MSNIRFFGSFRNETEGEEKKRETKNKKRIVRITRYTRGFSHLLVCYRSLFPVLFMLPFSVDFFFLFSRGEHGSRFRERIGSRRVRYSSYLASRYSALRLRFLSCVWLGAFHRNHFATLLYRYCHFILFPSLFPSPSLSRLPSLSNRINSAVKLSSRLRYCSRFRGFSYYGYLFIFFRRLRKHAAAHQMLLQRATVVLGR